MTIHRHRRQIEFLCTADGLVLHQDQYQRFDEMSGRVPVAIRLKSNCT